MDTSETKIYLIALIAATVLCIMLAYFIVNIIRQRKQRLLFQREKIQAEVMTVENERKRIAADLHDELGPLLSAVRMQINTLNTVDEEDVVIIDSSKNHIDSALHRLREISNGLMPMVLLRKGLIVSIREFINSINVNNVLSIDFYADDFVFFSGEMEIHMYRVLQEVIHNTIKHSKAGRLEIRIIKKDRKLTIATQDDGVGFDGQSVDANNGLGLINILSRVEILQGEVSISSKPGNGTQYVIIIPL